MEYHNFQTKRELEGVPFQSKPLPTQIHMSIDHQKNTKEGFDANTDLSSGADKFVFNNRDKLNADIPYGHIKSRDEVHLDDEIDLKDTYTTTSTLLAMAGISAIILGGMVWSNV